MNQSFSNSIECDLEPVAYCVLTSTAERVSFSSQMDTERIQCLGVATRKGNEKVYSD